MSKTIIITGGARGIGKACAQVFLDAGWRVGIVGRTPETVAEMADSHENALALPCDVVDEAQVDTAFDKAMAEWGRIDALFKILSGEEQEPTTIFNIYGSTIETELDPVFAEITFEHDFPARRARFVVDGYMEFSAEPIRNPVTGLDHFSQIVLPNGFEFRTAEMASATFVSKQQGFEMDRGQRYAALFYAAYGPYGIIPDETDAAMTAAMAA